MYGELKNDLVKTIGEIREAGLYKSERVIGTPQNASVRVGKGDEVLNFCANNYLGLADHPRLIEAAKDALDKWGFGMASVRFICGTQEPHKELERKLSEFLGTDDTILYSSCFDANGGVLRGADHALGLVEPGLPDLLDRLEEVVLQLAVHQAPVQSRMTLPHLPSRAVANASACCVWSNRCVMTGARSRPRCSSTVIEYQVSNISRP